MTEPTSPTAGLTAVVLAHDERGIGVPMLLHTARSLAATTDPARFSTAGYLHQAELGRRRFETGDPDADGSAAPLLALNFHEVPAAERAEAAARIRRLVGLGAAFDPDVPADGPQVMVAVYDGDRSTAFWAAALCRDLGLRAYFFPVRRTWHETGPRVDHDDLAALAEHHELCFHTATHRAAAEITAENAEHEVLAPLERLSRAAGRPPRLVAWRGGARFDGTQLGNRLVRERGVTHLVSNWSVEPVT